MNMATFIVQIAETTGTDMVLHALHGVAVAVMQLFRNQHGCQFGEQLRKVKWTGKIGTERDMYTHIIMANESLGTNTEIKVKRNIVIQPDQRNKLPTTAAGQVGETLHIPIPLRERLNPALFIGIVTEDRLLPTISGDGEIGPIGRQMPFQTPTTGK